jgi:flagellar biosynthesis repressor protein FlbT
MPLRFDLGPFEKLYIGKSVLTNNSDRTMFIVEGEAPILRARDVLTAERAIEPVAKLYLCVQQMYLHEDDRKYQNVYAALLTQAISERPASSVQLTNADKLIKGQQHYDALKLLRKLIRQEAFSFTKTAAIV